MPNPNFPLDSGGLRVGGVVDPYDAGTVAYYPRGRGTASGGTTFTRDSRELAVYSEGWRTVIGTTITTLGTAGTALRVGTANLANRLIVGIQNVGTVDIFVGNRADVGVTAGAPFFHLYPSIGTVGLNFIQIPINAGTTLYIGPSTGTAWVRIFEAA